MNQMKNMSCLMKRALENIKNLKSGKQHKKVSSACYLPLLFILTLIFLQAFLDDVESGFEVFLEDTCFIVEVLLDVSKNKVLFLDDVKVAFDIIQIVGDIFS